MSKVYAVWWCTAGEKNFGDGPMTWVGAFSDIERAKLECFNVSGSWINSGILTLELDAPTVTDEDERP